MVADEELMKRISSLNFDLALIEAHFVALLLHSAAYF